MTVPKYPVLVGLGVLLIGCNSSPFKLSEDDQDFRRDSRRIFDSLAGLKATGAEFARKSSHPDVVRYLNWQTAAANRVEIGDGHTGVRGGGILPKSIEAQFNTRKSLVIFKGGSYKGKSISFQVFFVPDKSNRPKVYAVILERSSPPREEFHFFDGPKF